ncbi:MAG: response regulator [Planctomycetaceae bacterium]|nr:response regulator [Planctomycetaceae bacterium]
MRPQRFLSGTQQRMASLCGHLFNVRTRLAIAMSVSVLSLVLAAQAFELIPDSTKLAMNGRKLQTETLAMSGHAIYEATGNIRAFERTLRNSLERSDDLISIGMRDNKGRLTINLNEHDSHWSPPLADRSSDRFMFVPIFRDQQRIGQLELSYQPLMGLRSWLYSDVAKLSIFMFGACFGVFFLLLSRVFRRLNPQKGAVPHRVREALGHLAEGLLVIDRRGNISLANSKFGKLVGQEADQLTGKSASDFPWQMESLPWEIALQEQRTVKDSNVRIADPEGVTRTFNVSASPVVTDKGVCRGAMVTFDDITILEEHKQELIKARKAADAANAAKSTFLSRMSHEIRTPMNAIIGYTDILRQGDSDILDQKKYLNTVHTNGEHLLDLINDILDLSKIEAGQMTIESRECELLPILNHVIDTLKIPAQQAGLSLKLVLQGAIPQTITADDTRLRQILINTVGNAIKFTRQGGVELSVRRCHEKQLLVFDVTDTGVGIQQDALEKIFKPFSQADDSVTRNFGGTGLGLAISKLLSESMGGGISVSSEVNVGTVFTISIDPGSLENVNWITTQETKLKQPMNSIEIDSRRFSGGHILIVDDAAANRDLTAIMLRRLGLTADKAENGLEALEMIEQTHYDVVLMDMHMPVMDGITATQTLRQVGSSICIIALTAMTVEEEKQRCLDAGCNGFLTKPIRMPALIDGLKPYLPLIDEAGESRETSVEQDALADEMESELAKTLAELGIADNERTAPQTSSDLILPAVVHCSMSLDSSEMRDIFEAFVARLHERIPEFREAWDSKNYAALVELGHWLAGAAGTMGLNDFVGPGRELENSKWNQPHRDAAVLEYIYALSQRIETPVSS